MASLLHRVSQVAALLGVVAFSTPAAASRPLWIWFDDDGTPIVSDRRDHPNAEPYRVGTFDEIALRQTNEPHRGSWRGDDGVGAPVVPADILALATEMAQKHKVERALLLAVIGVESAFRPDAVSRAGARGLMQLMPATADDLGVDPTIPRENVDGGAKYLAWLLRTFDDQRVALAAYNAGPGRVKRAGNRIPAIAETRAYVRAVTTLHRAYRRAGM
jgi:hypothetical protein